MPNETEEQKIAIQSQDRDQALIEAAMKRVSADVANQNRQSQQAAASEQQKKEEAATFTQDQVNAILAEHKRGLKDELAESHKTQEQLKTEMEQFKSMLQEAAKDAGYEYDEEGNLVEADDDEYFGGGDLDDLENIITPPKGVNKEVWKMLQSVRLGNARAEEQNESVINAMREELDAAKKQVEEERTIRLATEDRARHAERDRMITSALEKAQCNNLEAGRRYVTPDTEYVEGRGWCFASVGADGQKVHVPLDKGVSVTLPDELKKSAAPFGGSGSLGADGLTLTTIDSQINEMKTTLERLQEQARLSPNNARNISAYQAAKRQLHQLEDHKAKLVNG